MVTEFNSLETQISFSQGTLANENAITSMVKVSVFTQMEQSIKVHSSLISLTVTESTSLQKMKRA